MGCTGKVVVLDGRDIVGSGDGDGGDGRRSVLLLVLSAVWYCGWWW